jgi:hypothetical protein
MDVGILGDLQQSNNTNTTMEVRRRMQRQTHHGDTAHDDARLMGSGGTARRKGTQDDVMMKGHTASAMR